MKPAIRQSLMSHLSTEARHTHILAS